MYPVRKGAGTVLRAVSMPEKKLNVWLSRHLNSEIADIKIAGRMFRRVLVLYYEDVPLHPVKR